MFFWRLSYNSSFFTTEETEVKRSTFCLLDLFMKVTMHFFMGSFYYFFFKAHLEALGTLSDFPCFSLLLPFLKLLLVNGTKEFTTLCVQTVTCIWEDKQAGLSAGKNLMKFIHQNAFRVRKEYARLCLTHSLSFFFSF